MNISEHRFNRRQPTNFIAYIMWEGRLIEGTATNISPLSIAFETKSLTCPDKLAISICCFLNNKHFDIPGTIAYRDHEIVGIEFNQPQTEFFQCALAYELLAFSAA